MYLVKKDVRANQNQVSSLSRADCLEAVLFQVATDLAVRVAEHQTWCL